MAGFYGVYLAKQLSQRSQGIRTNQMGRGNKELRTLTVERLLAAFSVLIVVVEVWSVVRGYSFLPRWCGWIGLALTALGVVFFTTAVLQMRDSWRAGISPDEKTGLVTSGIYRISRNPAFVGFDLTYIGLLLCFANWLHLLVVLCAVAIFHLQIASRRSGSCFQGKTLTTRTITTVSTGIYEYAVVGNVRVLNKY